MGAKEFIFLTFALGIIVVSQAQYYGRMRGLNNVYKDYCTCTCEDIASLIALARVLEEKELCLPPSPPPPPPTNNPSLCLSNLEDLIMKLVNALVYTTTETTKNACCCSQSTPTNCCGGQSNGGDNSQSNGGLINVDVLNKNKNSNVLDVDVANQQIVGVGVGGGSSGQKPPGPKPPGPNPNNSNSGGGLINLDLLNSDKKNNVAELDVGNQNVLGVGLGGGGGGGNPPVPNNNGGYPKNRPNNEEGLINLDLLNKNNVNNVADLDVGGQTVLGVGLGS